MGAIPSDVASDDHPPHRYDARLAAEIEARWQARWQEQGTFHTPNPSGLLSEGFEERGAGKPKLYVMDMFPYPSGAGLHVGHPLGYIGTDVYARFQRMTGHNVLHTMGYDAFGLPAEEHARQTGEHPRTNTERNIATYRRQLRRLGLGHDERRSFATTDVSFYRWTQWIFLKIFESWFDPERRRARPVEELVSEFEHGLRTPLHPDTGEPTAWAELDSVQRRRVVDGHRLAYLGEAPVNWCPALGTVLANEEVTAEGRSERGNHPVFRRPLKQWMLRITDFADRLLEDLELLDWPDNVKQMQRNWVGRSEGAVIRFPAGSTRIEVFTTRPDTLFGATAMVLAPEHPLVDELTTPSWPQGSKPAWTGGHGTPPQAVAAYVVSTSVRTELDRQAESTAKTGVFTGTWATNPATGSAIPVFVADYVLMGYGTGAIMSVPGQDQRDWEFSVQFELDIVRTVQPPADFDGEAYLGEGPAVNSHSDEVSLDGLGVEEAKRRITEWLESSGHGHGTVTYRLRDWLFSRQRYWGEPFPIVYDESGLPRAVPEDHLPVELPDLVDWVPRALQEDSEPEPPLGRMDQWVTVELDLGDGPRTYVRELNTMPQWAGSSWYHLRYLDPTNEDQLVSPEIERYWMQPHGVDLYVGGVEHAVLHLLYARFWHKVLFDLGYVSTPEPFHRLYNQGYIQAFAFQDRRGVYVPAAEVDDRDGEYVHAGQAVTRSLGKMGKSLKNSVTPDEMFESYGADTLRLHEMFMGPLDQDRPWFTETVVGSHRLLQRVWRNLVDEQTGEVAVTDEPPSDELRRALHTAIAGVREDMAALRFNTAIAKITELNNEITRLEGPTPRQVAEPLVLLLAPLVPHVAEELWARLGHGDTVTYEPFPQADEALLATDTRVLPVQVNGKVRSRIVVASDADDAAVEAAALADSRISELTAASEVLKVIVVPGRLVNVVTS